MLFMHDRGGMIIAHDVGNRKNELRFARVFIFHLDAVKSQVAI